jgi:hypothetical protein
MIPMGYGLSAVDRGRQRRTRAEGGVPPGKVLRLVTFFRRERIHVSDYPRMASRSSPG